MILHSFIIFGFILIIVGVILIILGSILSTQKGETKVGVGGFIFFIPFGFANDPQMMKWVIVITAIVAIIFLILFLKGF